MNESQLHSISRRDLCEVIFRHKKKLVLVPLLAIVCGILALKYLPRTYRSEAQVYLRIGRENIGVDPTATTGHTVIAPQADRKDEVSSVMNVIQSRGVIAQAVDELGVETVLAAGETNDAKPNWLAEKIKAPLHVVTTWLQQLDPISDRERAIVQAERSLHVQADRGSTLLSITYDEESPQAAQKMCNAILNVFQREHMRIHRNQNSRPFFAEQHDRLRKELDEALDALRAAKNEMGLADVAQRRETLEAQYSSVELARLSTQQKLVAAQARIADLERQIAQLPERLVDAKRHMPNAGADLLRQQLYNLQVRSMDLEARYSKEHPLVIAVNEQVEEARRVLGQQAEERTETTDSINPVHRQLSLELKLGQSEQAGLKSSLGELGEQKESVLAELRAVNEFELKEDRLSRQAELARSNFMHYAQNVEEARIDKDLQAGGISNLSIVQTATLAEKPVAPSKPMIMLATLMLATVGTAALVIISEVLSDRLRTEADIERALELPVFTAIPRGRTQNRVPPVARNGKLVPSGHNG